jgi:hypothetical protein
LLLAVPLTKLDAAVEAAETIPALAVAATVGLPIVPNTETALRLAVDSREATPSSPSARTMDEVKLLATSPITGLVSRAGAAKSLVVAVAALALLVPRGLEAKEEARLP